MILPVKLTIRIEDRRDVRIVGVVANREMR